MKRIPLFIILLISIAFFSEIANAVFPDTENHEYKVAIDYLQSNGIVGGYPDGTFKPNNTVNRAEFTKIIVEAALGKNPTETAADCFPDVTADQWFASYVCYAKAQGIINGYPDGTFKPADTINLVEALKILSETLKVPLGDSGTEWYEKYLNGMSSKNYIPDSFFTLEQKVTRAQMSEMTWRILESKTNQPATSSYKLKETCYLFGEDVPSSIDMDKVRAAWLGWNNEARAQLGLYAYTYNNQLSRTAIVWSEVSKARGYMDHKRPGVTDFYNYAAITKWFKDLGLEFKNVNRVTHTENIGWGTFNCNLDDCTDSLINSIRRTFDFYIGEVNDEYRPHYNSIMNQYFKEIGLGIAIGDGKYYLTVHYGTEITSNPYPICK